MNFFVYNDELNLKDTNDVSNIFVFCKNNDLIFQK